MTDDITDTLEAKSDQLNAADIMGCDRIIKVRAVKKTGGDQPVSVYFDGDNNRPWKPSKGMRRVLAVAWGVKSKEWVGRHAQLFFEPSVMYAGKPVGGVRIKALSDIPSNGLACSITINRSKREPYHVEPLTVQATKYPNDRFTKALPKMAELMQTGEKTLQQIIAQCQKTGELTADQLEALESAAPVQIEEETHEHTNDNNEDEVM